MKAGWKTRIAERQYFEAKLAARQERVMRRAADQAKLDALKTEANARAESRPELFQRWINLANTGPSTYNAQTRPRRTRFF